MTKSIKEYAEKINRLAAEISKEVEEMNHQIHIMTASHNCPLGKVLIIQQIVADYYGLTISVMSSQYKPQKWADARFVAIYLCCELTDYSLDEIAECFNKRDHGSIIYARDEMATRIERSDKRADDVAELRILAANRLREASRIDLKAEMQSGPAQKKTA